MQTKRNRTFRLVSTLVAVGGAALTAAHEAAPHAGVPPKGVDGAQPHVENYWRASRFATSERRMLTFIEVIAETDLPLLLLAIATFLFTVAVAFSLPELVAQFLAAARVRERLTRAVSIGLFLAILGTGTAVALSVFDLDVGHQVLALGLVGIALSYGWGVEISNIAAGISLPAYAPIEVGRTITIERMTGVVEYVTLRYTRLRAPLAADGTGGNRIWVPNHYFAQFPCEEHVAPGGGGSSNSDGYDFPALADTKNK